MKNSNKTLKVQEIKELGISEMDVMGYDYGFENDKDNYYLAINGERVVNFSNTNDRKKTFDKIKRMGLGLGWKAPILTDEEEGIIQAGKNGENPFAYTIISR